MVRHTCTLGSLSLPYFEVWMQQHCVFYMLLCLYTNSTWELEVTNFWFLETSKSYIHMVCTGLEYFLKNCWVLQKSLKNFFFLEFYLKLLEYLRLQQNKFMFDFKRLKELLRNAFKVSNDKKLSLSEQCSVSYSKHLLSNHTLNGVFH